MDTDKIYKLLDSIAEKASLKENDINTLLGLSNSDNPEIRSYVAELLVSAHGKKAEKTLINMCVDKDEIVRANACDSLSVFPTFDSYNRLIKCVNNDKSAIVKTYAILSLADIFKRINIDTKDLKKLFITYSQDENVSVSAACCRGLYILGEKSYLEKLFKLFVTENYQERCMIINILNSVINNENDKRIFSELRNFRKFETSAAVASLVDGIFDEHKVN